MSEKDGGPAFPTHIDKSAISVEDFPGMTLRDYFAAQAMAGSLAGVPGPHLIPETLARDAYAHADALLKARDR